MTYAEIIQNNCEKVNPSWWPKFAYHYTDVTNAVSILSSGKLYSRVKAGAKGVMENDNASRQVIDMTETRTTSYVRFYFRPLTPTQYHNEGYKHRQIRYDGDINANVPVPVFLLFDLEKLLLMEGTKFSALSQAGHGNPVYSGTEAFAALPFDSIYSNGYCTDDVRVHRHAEILYPDEFPIDSAIRGIFCRNDCERSTLMNLLKDYNPTAFYRYKDMIRVARSDTFERNGFFVETILFHDDTISFVFAETPQKMRYADRYAHGTLERMEATFLFEWKNTKETLKSSERTVSIDYCKQKSISFERLPHIQGARTLRVTLKIDGQLICVFEHSLTAFELV